MIRTALLAGLLLGAWLPVQAEIVPSHGVDGRLYFTNLPRAASQTLRTTAPPAGLPLQRQTGPLSTLRLIQELARQYSVETRLVQAIVTVDGRRHSVSQGPPALISWGFAAGAGRV
jgi:hypothetical protein